MKTNNKLVNKSINLDLVGLDGNAFALMGAFSRQARREKWTKEEIDLVLKDAMSGDYDHLLSVLAQYCDPENRDCGDDEDDGCN